MIFTDEMAVEKGKTSGRVWTIRHPGEEFDMKHLQPTFKQERETLNVWGAIAWGKKWPLLRLSQSKPNTHGIPKSADRFVYTTRVLEDRLSGYCSELRREGRRGVLVVEDGASTHTSLLARQAKEELHIKTVTHPPNSPDLNAIETCWLIVKSRLKKFRPVASTADKLWEQLEEIWDGISQEEINRQVEGMVRRRADLVAANGFHIGF